MIDKQAPKSCIKLMPAGQLSDLKQTLAGMRRILGAQTRLIDLCLHRLKEIRDGKTPLPTGTSRKVFDVTLTMIHVTGVSAHSILKLTEEIGLQARDGYPIARSIIEAVINIGFIMAEGDSAAELADRHAKQKAFRDLKRTSSVAGHTVTVGWSGKLSPEDEAHLASTATEFTTKAGRERRYWTDKSLENRLEVIAGRFGHRVMTMLHPAMLMIYRHASEIVHGTYFSALFFWGVTRPGQKPATADGLRVIMGNHQLAVLLGVILANTALLDCAGQYFGFTDLNKGADELVRQLEALPLIKEGLAASH